MSRYIIRRCVQGLLVVLGVMAVVFVVTRLVGDPVRLMLPIDAPASARVELRKSLGLDASIPVQFVRYASHAVRGDFGNSLWQQRSALKIVAERLPNTIKLTALGMLIALLIAIPLGTIAALKPNAALDRVATTSSLFGLSMPGFWLGLMFILIFAVWLRWLPTSGTGDWKHLILPSLTLALPSAGKLTMLTRSSMIDELNRPWIKVARAKGMPVRRTVAVHALRNASVSIVTVAGWEMIRMLAGSTILVESVFAWPGTGLLALQAVQRNDLFLLQAIVLVVAVITVVLNIVIDLVYQVIDPRIRLAAHV